MDNKRDDVPAKGHYYFEEISKCEMCGDLSDHHFVLGQRLNQSQGLSPRTKTGISVSILKCKKCSLIYAQPMPIPYDIHDHYGKTPESYWHESYFLYDGEYFLSQINDAKALLPFKNGMMALDVGAGLGKGMISLKKAGFEAFGFEPSKPFFDRAISKMGIEKEKLKLGMMEEMNYAENSFDFITFGAVLEHLYHPSKSLSRALTWLKPQGIIHIEVPSSKHLVAKLINFYYRLRGTSYVTNLSPMHGPFHLYEFDLKSFEELGNNIGFKVEKYEYSVMNISHFPKFLHPLLTMIMKLTNSGLQLTVYLRKQS